MAALLPLALASAPRAAADDLPGLINCFAEPPDEVFYDLGPKMLVHNNLGGFGPTPGVGKLIYLQRAGAVDGHEFDIALRNLSAYTPRNVARNGLPGYPGHPEIAASEVQINLIVDSHVEVELAISDSATGAPLSLRAFTLWFTDIDMNENGDARESIVVPSYENVRDPPPPAARPPPPRLPLTHLLPLPLQVILSEEHGLATSREGAGAKIQAKQVGFLTTSIGSRPKPHTPRLTPHILLLRSATATTISRRDSRRWASSSAAAPPCASRSASARAARAETSSSC